MTEPPQPQVQEDQEALQRATGSRRGKPKSMWPPSGSWCGGASASTGCSRHGGSDPDLPDRIFAEFVAPFTPDAFDADYTYAPPQRLHFFDEDGFGLYVYGYSSKLNEETLVRTFEVDESKKVPVRLFAQGNTYKLWGLFESDLHLIGPVEKGSRCTSSGPTTRGRTC